MLEAKFGDSPQEDSVVCFARILNLDKILIFALQ